MKLATIVEGVQKAPFSIATTLRCRGGRYSFPLKSLVRLDLGLKPSLLNHWRTLYSLDQFVTGSTFYNRTFFKEINTNEFFHVLKDCQHDLHYWPLRAELFLYQSQCVYTPWTIFSTEVRRGKSMFNQFVKIFFDKDMLLRKQLILQ